MTDRLNKISDAMRSGESSEMGRQIKEAIAEGISAKDILNSALLSGMAVISDGFKKNELYVPEVIVASRSFNYAVELLKPYLIEPNSSYIGRAVIGTVKGDMHDIGKNLVRMMLTGKGIEVMDLGVDVDCKKFVEAVQEFKPQTVLISALLTTTMMYQGVIIQALKEASLRDSVKVIVGGAPVTQGFAAAIGADAYEVDAASAADKAYEYTVHK